jgi:hypothetical protein
LDLPLLAERYDQGDAGCPGGQHVNKGNEFDEKCGQQERVEADDPNRQDHRYDINRLIENYPAERAQPELDQVRRYRHGIGQPDSISREDRCVKHNRLLKPYRAESRDCPVSKSFHQLVSAWIAWIFHLLLERAADCSRNLQIAHFGLLEGYNRNYDASLCEKSGRESW